MYNNSVLSALGQRVRDRKRCEKGRKAKKTAGIDWNYRKARADMSKETITEITRAEEEADRLRKNANAEAEAMKNAAEREGNRLCEQVSAETEAEIGEKMEKIRALNQSKKESGKKDTVDEVRLAIGKARNHMETAVGRILDELQDIVK